MSKAVVATKSVKDGATKLTPYLKRMIAFLSVATFFEGYDFMALTQLLPELRREFGLSHFQSGAMMMAINVGTILAYGLVRKADTIGRRPILNITVVGYLVTTLVSAAATNVFGFVLAQTCGRVFLVSEYSVSVVMVSEEMPAEHRGSAIGIIGASAMMGAIVCIVAVPLLVKFSLGWRTVYLVGALPLVTVAYVRRGLKETSRFLSQKTTPKRRSFMYVLRSPFRKRIFQLGLIWFLSFLCTQNAMMFWKDFAVEEREMTPAQIGASLAIATVTAFPLSAGVGKLLDLIGRRPGAVVVFLSTSIGVFCGYTLRDRFALTAALALGTFGTSAVLPLLNTYSAELFPTELRSDAFAWSCNLIGRGGFVLSPMLVGALAEVHGWGAAVRVTTVMPLLALALVFAFLPETGGKELEEASRLE